MLDVNTSSLIKFEELPWSRIGPLFLEPNMFAFYTLLQGVTGGLFAAFSRDAAVKFWKKIGVLDVSISKWLSTI